MPVLAVSHLPFLPMFQKVKNSDLSHKKTANMEPKEQISQKRAIWHIELGWYEVTVYWSKCSTKNSKN